MQEAGSNTTDWAGCIYPGRITSPGCSIDYIDDNQHHDIGYDFSLNYLPNWMTIHNNLLLLIAQFERDGNSDSVK